MLPIFQKIIMKLHIKMYYLSVSNKTSFVQLIAFSINLNYNTFSLNYMQSFP